jgi:hypothetical protein
VLRGGVLKNSQVNRRGRSLADGRWRSFSSALTPRQDGSEASQRQQPLYCMQSGGVETGWTRDQFLATAAKAFETSQLSQRGTRLELENAKLKKLVGELLLELKGNAERRV